FTEHGLRRVPVKRTPRAGLDLFAGGFEIDGHVRRFGPCGLAGLDHLLLRSVRGGPMNSAWAGCAGIPIPSPIVRGSTPVRCHWIAMKRGRVPIHSLSNPGATAPHEGDRPMALELGGIHHLTAVTADAPRNLKFYTRTLGMRLIKKTV